MRKIKIVADSACDLFQLEKVDFASAALKVITDEREFIDNERLDVSGMVAYLDKYKGKSKSSCPNPTDWITAFGDADDILCITITGGLSGSYNSACVAKNVYESSNKGKRVFVLDSRSAGPEMTLAVEKMVEYIEMGMEYTEICEKIASYIQFTGLTFMLKSLKTFANNGRVSPLVARLVGIAGICIVGKASDEGTLEPMHKIRGEKASLEMLATELVNQGWCGGKVSIGHCQNENGAKMLRDILIAKYPAASVEIHAFKGLCSFYAEKGGILVGFEKKGAEEV